MVCDVGRLQQPGDFVCGSLADVRYRLPPAAFTASMYSTRSRAVPDVVTQHTHVSNYAQGAVPVCYTA
jgi:hypothetical protein